MAGEGFTILHASDFQLDVPLGGLRWIPEAIKSAVLAAPEVAALRVFDLAIKQRVDLLALTGNLLCPVKSSARALSFLEGQFARMHEHDIPVVWATGASDPLDAWPTSMAWPDSLIRFDRGSVDRRVMTLGETDIEILGCGSDAAGNINSKWFDGLSRGEHQLVIGGGTVDTFKNLAAAGLWLLGGRSYAEHLSDGNANLFYAGVPQGRCLADSGPRGAQLIHVSEQVACRKLDCAAIRYENISIAAESICDFDDLELQVCEHVETNNWESDRITLVQWDVNCKHSTGAFHNTNAEFMRWQQKFSQRSMLSDGSVYTLGVNVHCQQDETGSHISEDLLGDYLFALESLRENGWSEMQLDGVADAEQAPDCWSRVDEDLEGLRTLDDAARLGELLLGGHANSQSDPTKIESEAA
jgi:exonuclease SbcD